jgi:CheY-like chemotaxis protein
MTKQSQRVIRPGVEAADSVDHQRLLEPERTTQGNMQPVALTTDSISAPKSETGVAAAVAAIKEGGEDDRVQDAPRAVGEAQAQMGMLTRHVVMIVEDTVEIAEVIQAALARANLKTVHELHGGKALSRYEEHKPDLILLDIGLPDISGWQFLEGLKERHKAANKSLPPVIVITAFGDPANRLVGKFQGVHDYLIKPFTAAEVERVVTKALATRSE